jgi:LytS/YehU family sensor histidine kinase
MFIFAYFGLGYLLPAWFGGDQRESLYHFMHIAYVADMGFYFTGLAYRDRQAQKDKVLLENDLKLQQLEGEKTKAEFEQHASQLEMQALRAQMNPHFIFNSLNSINRFILQNNKAEASEYLTKFSKLVRLILQNSQESLITLENELESLKLYLDLEALRCEHRFDFKISFRDELEPDVLQVPPLIIQPYAENAIWHGLMHLPDPIGKEEKGHLNIDIEQKHDELLLKITDNGIGRKKAAELKSKSTSTHKSMGIEITESRIAMMQLNGTTKSVEIKDLVYADGSAAGTEVTIKIPVLFE